MGAFPTLMTELHCMILGYCDRSSLHSLSLVSKAIVPVANQFLYREVHWIWSWSKSPPLGLLLRTILNRPELALLIKYARFGIDEWYQDDHSFGYTEEYLEDIPPIQLDAESKAKAKDLLQRMEIPDLPKWNEALEEGSIDALVALLVAQLLSLETLQMAESMVHNSIFMGMMLKHIIKPRSGKFEQLRRVKFSTNQLPYEAAYLNTSIDQVVPLFYLPSLQELEVTVNEPSFSLEKPPSTPSPLRTLRFFQCDFTPKDLGRFLAMTPSVKELHCGFLRDIRIFGEGDRVDFKDLLSALAHTAHTLEALKIEINWHEKNCTNWAVPLRKFGSGCLGSLQRFSSLRRLEIPIALLMGPAPWDKKRLLEILPRSLRLLILTDDTVTWHTVPKPPIQEYGTDHSMQDVIDALGEYLRNCEQNAPMLENISLEHYGVPYKGGRVLELGNTPGDRGPSQPEQLRSIAEASGVGIWVGFIRSLKGEGSHRASVKVYDPKEPDKALWESEVPRKIAF